MSKLTHFTIEVYKADKRIKKDARHGKDKKGLRFVDVIDFAPSTKDYIDTVVKRYVRDGYFAQAFETYVVKKNAMTPPTSARPALRATGACNNPGPGRVLA